MTQQSEVGVGQMVFYIPMIHSGMVRDVGVPAPAASLTIHHGFASNSLSQLLMILSLGFVNSIIRVLTTHLLKLWRLLYVN